MSLVYSRISVPLADELPMFWKKLKDFVGDYRIEPHGIDEWVRDHIITISFYTDKIEFKEGETRQVELIAKYTDENKNWEFTELRKTYE